MPIKNRCVVLAGSNSRSGSVIRIDGRLLYVSESNQSSSVSEFSFDSVIQGADQDKELIEHVVRPSTSALISGTNSIIVAFGAHSPSTLGVLPQRAAEFLHSPFASLLVAVIEVNGEQSSEVLKQTSLQTPSQLPSLLSTSISQSNHRIVTLTMIAEDDKGSLAPVLSLVSLGNIDSSDADALAQSLAAISKGKSPPYESKLTTLLKTTLSSSSQVILLPTLMQGQPYQDSLSTLKFALKCQGLSSEPQSQRGVAVPAFETVKQLRQELEMTHAHYQKLLEAVAGPEWSKDMGAIERDVYTPRKHVSGSESIKSQSKPEEDNASIASSKWETAKSKMHVGAGGNVAAMDAQIKTLKSQVDAYRLKLIATEALMEQRRQEQEASVDRMMSKDRSQLAEIKRLRQQLMDAKTGREDAESHRQQFEEESRARHEHERARLEGDMEALRAQMQQMALKMDLAEKENGIKAEEERKRREARVESAEDKVREHVAAAAAEKARQVENIKQQSQYHLTKKADEVAALRNEIARLKSSREEEMRTLQAEVECLVAYGEKATELLRRVEAGSYPVTERAGGPSGGLRQFKIPLRDRPGALHGDRLKTLKGLVEGIDRLVASTVEASSLANAASTLPSASMHGASRPSSAVSRRSEAVASSSEGPALALSLAGGEQQLEQLRAQWEASMRESITNQIVTDLKSDQTVEYIRSLEAQLARYRSELQAERKKQVDMTVALRSVQRQVARPDSALNRALISTGPLSPASGPSWGPGHSPKNYRPVTASPTMRSGLGSPGSPATTNNRTNAWAVSQGSFSSSREGF